MSIALTAYDVRLALLDCPGRQLHNHFSRRPARVLGASHMEYIMSPSPVPQVRLTTVATFPKNYSLENLAVPRLSRIFSISQRPRYTRGLHRTSTVSI
jgi:hypothetical protein